VQADANTSWGGNVINSGGDYHMFVNAIANQHLFFFHLFVHTLN
jgi:hypothetical protein